MTREELNQDKQQEIINEQKRERRKKITVFLFKISIIIIVVFVLFYLYTTYVSSAILSLNEHRIVDKDLPNSFSGLKVVHISDFHYGTTFFIDELENVVEEINKRNVDLVFFTGDLIDSNYVLTTSEQKKIISLLDSINANLGKYAVYGEEDGNNFELIMERSNFIILKNNYELIYNGTHEPILLTGTGSLLKKETDINSAFGYFNDNTYNSNIFTISLIHEPDIIDSIVNKYKADLVLAGHSHNGTIRIPFFGGIYKNEGALKYIDPYYSINDSNLFISSGLGTDAPGFRLFCRPSLNFFRLSNK